MTESGPPCSRLEQDIAHVAAAWAVSAYYDNAERWTFLFWEAGTEFRRLFDKLDLTSVVELACGHGRHSEQIVETAGSIVMIDIFDDNLEFCRKRFGNNPKISFIKGSGGDFRPLKENSITAIFCYDAMVHFSPEMVRAYLRDAARILKPGGMALLHHSNYPAPRDRNYGLNPHARNHMTTQLFVSHTREAGLSVVETRVIPWGGVSELDALSLARKEG